MSIPLAGDVPPQHLICPVHSAGRRRPGHPAGGVPVYSIGRLYAVLWHTLCSSSLTRYRGRSRDISISYRLWTLWRWEITQALQALVISFHFAHGTTCRSSVSLYVPPLSYKGEGTLRYRTDPTRTLKLTSSLRPSLDSQMDLDSHTHLHALKSQYNTQWSRVLRYSGLNHSKPLCVLVFIDHLVDRQNAYAPPHLRI
jgi:hypothetical protein